ncbi:MAG: tetratricopeptide repeat protein [Bacteroidota bacterium]
MSITFFILVPAMVPLFLIFSLFTLGGVEDIQLVEDIHQSCYQLLDTDPDSALVLAEQSLQLALDTDYTWGAANSYYIKGYIFHKLQNKSVAALLMYMRAGNLLEQHNDPKSANTLADVYINAGSILRIHGKMDEAILLYDKALDKLEKYEGKERELLILFNKAYALHDKENYDETVTVLTQCISLAKTTNNTTQLNNSWNLFGDTMLKIGKVNEAIKCFQRVIENDQSNDDSRANSANNLADYYLSKTDLDSSKYYYQLAIEFSKDLSIPVIPFYGYKGLAQCYLKQQNIDEGIEAGNEALALYDLIIAEDEHFLIFDIMSDLYSVKGNNQMSHYYSKKYVDETTKYFNAQKELIDVKNEFQIDLLLASFYSEIELEKKDEKYASVFILAGTILLGICILFLAYYRKKSQSNFKEIASILNDIK